jgi:hypothetical protein
MGGRAGHQRSRVPSNFSPPAGMDNTTDREVIDSPSHRRLSTQRSVCETRECTLATIYAERCCTITVFTDVQVETLPSDDLVIRWGPRQQPRRLLR